MVAARGSGHLPRRRWARWLLAASLLAAVLAVGWWFLSSGVWRRGVGVVSAELRSPTDLVLIVDACDEDAELDDLRETDRAVLVRVDASFAPLRGGGLDCLTSIEVPLQDPLGDRIVVDLTTLRQVGVTRSG